MPVLSSNISPQSEAFLGNREAHQSAMDVIKEAEQVCIGGGGGASRERHVARGKLLPRDRVAALIDPGSPFLEIGLFGAFGLYEGACPAAGVIAGNTQTRDEARAELATLDADAAWVDRMLAAMKE